MEIAKTNAKEWTVNATTCDSLKFVQEYSVMEKSDESTKIETNLDKLKVKKRLQASWNALQKDYTKESNLARFYIDMSYFSRSHVRSAKQVVQTHQQLPGRPLHEPRFRQYE